jgi:acyl carrier protein
VTETDVLDVIRAAVVTVLEVRPDDVARETRFVDDLRADSLAIVEIVEIVEEQLARARAGFRIDDELLDELVTVADALDHAMSRL